MKKLLYNKWVILFFNVIVFALMAWLLPIHFEENDDVSMCMIANGVYSGVPDGHLVFINALYGWIVAGLYRLTRIVEWYTLSFCVLHILSMTGIVYLVLRDDRMNSVIKVFLLIVLYVLWARVIIAFQFTTTAGLLCFSGCLALLHSNRKWKVVGVGAVFVASLIRFQAAGLVGLMCAPLFLIEFFRERSIASWALLAILFVLAGRLSEQLFYMQPEWAEYKAYDAIRGGINDNPNGYLSELDMPEDVNIEDYELLFVWHQGDRGVLTYPRMKELKAKIDERGIPYDCIMLRIRQVFKSYRVWWMLVFEGLLLIVLLNVVNMRQKQKNSSRFERDVFATDKYWLYGVSLGFLVFVALAVYVCLTGMLKHRVFWCMLVPMVYMEAKAFPVMGKNKIGFCLFSLMLLTLAGYTAKQIRKSIIWYQWDHAVMISKELPLLEGKTGVIFPEAFTLEHLPPFEIKDVGFHITGRCWLTGNPLNKGTFESHRDFVEKDILYFHYADDEYFLLPLISRGIERNYGIPVEVEKVDSNDKYALYKFRKK